MHSLEPHFLWRDYYRAEEDARSSFYGREYSEFYYTQKVYNHLIHPQWDEFGSETLYLKLLYVDYLEGFAVIELIGEWNDCLHSDISYLKEQVLDILIDAEVNKFILLGEYVFNFHAGEEERDYYQEWAETVQEEGGWIALLNFLPHVLDEMQDIELQEHLYLGQAFSDITWRPLKPQLLFKQLQERIDDFDNYGELDTIYLD